MRVLLRFLGILSLLVVLLGVRNADAACPRVCLHQGLAHSCSWARGTTADSLEDPGAPVTVLSAEAPATEEASMPVPASLSVRRASSFWLSHLSGLQLASQLALGPPIPPPRRSNA